MTYKARFFLFFARLVQKSGVRGVYRLADFLGALMWRVLAKRRETTIHCIGERLELPPDQARTIARASFNHTARSFLDILIAGKLGSKEIPFSSDSWKEVMERVEKTERPMVVITGHFGPWEMGGGLIGKTPGKRVFSVVRKYKDPAIQSFIRELRLENGLETVDHRDATGIIISTLRDGGVACFLADHNSSRKESIFIPFLGKEAAVNMGPALLAVRTRALVQPNFIRREKDGSVVVLFDEPLDTAQLSGSVNERVRQVAEFYTQAIERQVRACPEQWFWMHNRWKTRPKGE